MEAAPISHWKVRLQQLLSHPEFHSATDEQRLEVLREVLRQSSTPIENLNEVIRESWRSRTPIPQLTIDQRQLQLSYPSQYSSLNLSSLAISPPKPLSPVLDSDTFVYGDSREQILDRRFVDQLQEFIATEPAYLEETDRQIFLPQLNELVYQVQSTISTWQRTDNLNRIEHVKLTDGWQRRFARLLIDIRNRRQSSYPIDINPDYLKLPSQQLRQPVDLAAARQPLGKLFNYVNQKLATEVAAFGDKSAFSSLWLLLRNDIAAYPNKIMSQQLTWRDLINKTLTWRDEIVTLLEEQQIAGRRCQNSTDPWDATPIEDIPNNDYIHLSNGMCWHIESLMEYIKGVNGLNEASGLPNYASSNIWEPEDLPRILQHPAVKRTGFGEWLQRVLSANSVKTINRDTIDWLYWLASLFVSRGEPFKRELRNVLTPEEYAVYQQYTGGDSDLMKRIPVELGGAAILQKVKVDMKADAFKKFMEYYNELSSEDKAALDLLYRGFERDLLACDLGRLCVYVAAKSLMLLYRRLAELKGITPLQLDITER